MNNLDQNFNNTMIVAAGGTGGHIFPALSLIDKIIDLELTLKSFIHEKRVAMTLKNNGLKKYKESLNKIKNLLTENLLKP